MCFSGYIKNLSVILMFFVYTTHGQIAVTNNAPFDNAQGLVEDVLLGQGIVASNFTWQNGPQNIGYFDGVASNVGFDEGVIMCTGGIDFVATGAGAGPGISGDPDLEQALSALGMSGFSVNNVTILEFDFVAQSDEMSFWYSFGSMEYTGYTCSSFNDVFGFFISGPGINGPYTNNGVNIALVPDPAVWTVDGAGEFNGVVDENLFTTTPVAVNTVNNGDPNEDWGGQCESLDPDWESYNTFWIDNDYSGAGWQGVNQPPNPEFTVEGLTGFTVPLPAYINNLTCDSTYHIKLAIADCADGILNSAVFLEANSFSSPNVQISTVPNTELGLVLNVDNGVLEGCGQAALQFDRGGDLSMDLNITLSYSGNAEYGIDYAELPTEMVLPAFEEQIIIPIDILFDNIDEESETLIVTVSGVPVPCEVEATEQDIEIIIFDQEELLLDMPPEITIDCLGSANIEALVEGGYPPYNYTWYNELGEIVSAGELDSPGIVNINPNPSQTTYYTLTVTDDCLDQVVSDVTDVVVQEQVLDVSLGGECPEIEGFIYLGSLDGSGYYLSESMSTWELANITCNNLGGNLVTINSAQEQEFVFNIAMNNSAGFTNNYWIGLNDYDDEGSFTWVNGDPVTYTNWNGGEPNGGANENGVEVFSINANYPGFWNDAPDWVERRMVLEIPCEPLNDIFVCEDELANIVLDPEINGGLSPYTYTWFYNGVVISNEEVLSDLPGEGLYQFIAEEACGDIDGDQISVSFIELAPYVELISYDVLDPSILPEGCFQSILQFNVPEIQDEDINLEFYVTGSAESDDYSIESTSVIIPAGEESVLLPISIEVDEEIEGVESLVFNFPFIDVCSDWPTEITIQIYDPPILSVEVADELILCEDEVEGGMLEGFFSGGIGLVNYGWYYDGEIISTDMDISTSNLEAGIYSFIAVDQCGNSASADVDFQIINLTPSVTLSSDNYDDPSQLYEGCGSSILTFTMEYASSEDMIYYYNITGSSTFINGVDIEEINNYVEIPAGVMSVDVEIIPFFDDYNEDSEVITFEFPFSTDCVPQENIEIVINNYYPIELVVPDDQSLCAGQSVELQGEYFGGMAPFDASWSYLTQSDNSEFAVFDVEEGVFDAVFTVTDDCGFSQTAVVEIEGLGVDMFEVVWPPTEVFACYGDNSEINLVIEGGLPPFTFEWFLDGQPTNTPTPSLPFNDDNFNNWIPGSSQLVATAPPYTPYTYTYDVLITDSCSNQLEYNIDVNIEDCLMPTTFTPNGDGNNDIFWVNFGDLVGPVSLEVFNRWGDIVYRSMDYRPCANYKSDCWDGTHFQNYGQECTEGTYYYVFTYSRPIYNLDSYDVSNFVEGVFGRPHNNSKGTQRTGNLLLLR